ncbi:MAG: hypothetical protein OXK80_04385 [Bdellovibrionales bacterium]|nr:hypothetical protein [Bdellovibrionales bacterium]
MKHLSVLAILLLPFFSYAGVTIALYDNNDYAQLDIEEENIYKHHFSLTIVPEERTDQYYRIEIPKLKTGQVNGHTVYIGKTIIHRRTEIQGGWNIDTTPFEHQVIIYPNSSSEEESAEFVNHSDMDMGDYFRVIPGNTLNYIRNAHAVPTGIFQNW